MISKPKGISAKRWGSGVLVGAVSALVMGVPFAPAANAAASSVTATPTTNNQPAGTSLVYQVATTGTVVNLEYSVLSDPNGAVQHSANTAKFPASLDCGSNTTCTIPTTGIAGTASIRIFDDSGATVGQYDSGEAFSDVTGVLSGVPFSVTLAPDTATTPVGNCQKYTITATDSGGRPASGYDINLTVHVTSPSTGLPAAQSIQFCDPGNGQTPAGVAGGTGTTDLTGTVTTDSSTTGNKVPGQVIFGIKSTTPATATVTAASVDTPAASDSSTETFTAGGPEAVKTLTVSPTTSKDYVFNETDFTVTAKDANGNPVSNVDVSFGVTTGADSTVYPADGSIDCNNNGSGNTDNSGQTTCFLQNQGTVTTDNVVFWVNQTTGTGAHTGGPDTGEPQTTATAQFIANPPSTDTITVACPGTNVNPGPVCELKPGTSPVTFTATVKDTNGNPVSGVIVDFYFDNVATAGTITPAFAQGTTGTDGTASATVTDSAPTAGNKIRVVAEAGNGGNGVNAVQTATYTTPAPFTFSLSPTDETVAKGGTVTFTAKVVDQFGTGVSNQSITYTVSGRNSGKTGTVTTGSDGTAVITYTDAGVNAAATTDTVTATDTSSGVTNGNQATSTVHYITGSTTASTITVDVSGQASPPCPAAANSSSTKTAAALPSNNNICAVVKNSAGEVLAGKSVTLTVSIGTITAVNGGTTGISTDGKSATAVTDANGIVTATVRSTTSGNQTITVAADSATGTGTITYPSPAASEARNVALAPANPTVNSGTSQVFTATVTDVFGNPVPGVNVLFTQTGAGSFAGSSSASATTNQNGAASVTLTTQSTDSGTGTVTANITSTPANQCAQPAGAGHNATANTTAGNCTASSTYTVKTAASPSSVTVSAPNGTTGHVETAHATVKNSDGTPAAAGFVVTFSVSGANNASGSATTNSSGVATFSYTPHSAGSDTITAIVNTGSAPSPSGSKTVKISPPAKRVMHLHLSCFSRAKHVAKCVAQTSPVRKGLRVIIFMDGHKIGAGNTNAAGQFSAKKTGLRSKSHHRFSAHLNGTGTTTSADSNTVKLTIL